MKSAIISIALGLGAVSALSDRAEAASSRSATKTWSTQTNFGTIGVRIGQRTRISVGNGCGTNIRHSHRYTLFPTRIWIAPVYEQVVVGYDSCRRPIYRTVEVRVGYWKTTYERVCSCGARLSH